MTQLAPCQCARFSSPCIATATAEDLLCDICRGQCSLIIDPPPGIDARYHVRIDGFRFVAPVPTALGQYDELLRRRGEGRFRPLTGR